MLYGLGFRTVQGDIGLHAVSLNVLASPDLPPSLSVCWALHGPEMFPAVNEPDMQTIYVASYFPIMELEERPARATCGHKPLPQR